MPMLISGTTGYYTAFNIYNLGNAHGHWPHPNLLSFANAMKSIINSHPTNKYYAWSNRGQETERGYLASMGFDTRRVGSLYLSSIAGADLSKFFANDKVFGEERKKEKERKEAAVRQQAEAREVARQAAEARRIRRENHISKDGSRARKRGELRVGDTIHRYRTNIYRPWNANGIVEEVGTNYVIISGNRINYPTFNNGSGNHNIERIPPKTYNRNRWW